MLIYIILFSAIISGSLVICYSFDQLTNLYTYAAQVTIIAIFSAIAHHVHKLGGELQQYSENPRINMLVASLMRMDIWKNMIFFTISLSIFQFFAALTIEDMQYKAILVSSISYLSLLGLIFLIKFKKEKTLARWYSQKDNCEICDGEKGGVSGNENLINGQIVCDFCTIQKNTTEN